MYLCKKNLRACFLFWYILEQHLRNNCTEQNIYTVKICIILCLYIPQVLKIRNIVSYYFMIFCITFRNLETHCGNRWLSWRIFWIIHDLINEWNREILTFWSKMIFFCYTSVHFRIPQTSQNLPFHSWSTNVCNYIKSSTNIFFFDGILYWDILSTNTKVMFAFVKNVISFKFSCVVT